MLQVKLFHNEEDINKWLTTDPRIKHIVQSSGGVSVFYEVLTENEKYEIVRKSRDKRLDFLDLPIRAYNALLGVNSEIHSDVLAILKIEEPQRVKNFGRHSFYQTCACLLRAKLVFLGQLQESLFWTTTLEHWRKYAKHYLDNEIKKAVDDWAEKYYEETGESC